MFQLDLSSLSYYVNNQKNANKTKFNLSNNLLKFLQEKNWDIKIIKISLIRAYFANESVENEAEKLTLLQKRYWRIGQLWSPAIDEGMDFNINIAEACLKNPSAERFIAEGIPPQLTQKFWYQSQKFHIVIYELYQQAVEYEQKLQQERTVFSSTTGF